MEDDKNKQVYIGNQEAARDIINNYAQLDNQDLDDYGIIDEIFTYVIANLKPTDKQNESDNRLLRLTEKIRLNFSSEEDREAVQEFFNLAYTKICLIEKRIQQEDSDVHNDLSSHVLGVYRELKRNTAYKSNLEILENMFSRKEFLKPSKKGNPQYTNLTKAFVLFFFDDCTIFEKTIAEKGNRKLC